MKYYCFIFLFLFSLSCHSQESLKIDFSISKENEALFIHIKNESDSTFYLHNGGRILHRIEDHRGSCIFISDKKKDYYARSEMYFPINSYTGEKWFEKECLLGEIKPLQESVMDIIGIRKNLLEKDKVYVKLSLIICHFSDLRKKRHMIVEKWVSVE